MNLSQKRYFTLLQMLENMQTTIVGMQAAIKEIVETTDQTNEVVIVLNGRLLMAGQAILGKGTRGFKPEFREKFHYGFELPE
jgi:hypothetical protein